MPLVIPPNFALVRMDFTRDGSAEQIAITMGIAPDTVPSTPSAIGNAVNDAWEGPGSLITVLNPLTTHTNTHVILGSDGPPFVGDTAGTGPGTASAGALSPPAVSPLMAKVTGFAGRKFRGRFYFPDIKETSTDDAGRIPSATLTTYQMAADAFLTSLEVSGFPMTLLHSDVTLPTLVSSLVVRAFVATQRGRQQRT